MNMVRTGVAIHPQQWPSHGYNEVLNSSKRYSVIDITALMNLCSIQNSFFISKELKIMDQRRITNEHNKQRKQMD